MKAGNAARRLSWIFSSALGALAVLATGAAFLPAPASAGTLDQQQPNTVLTPPLLGGAIERAQSYTAGISGQQDQVDVFVDESPGFCGPTPDGLTAEIQTVGDNGAPSGAVLATTTVPHASIPTFVPGTTPAPTPILFPAPPTVAAGGHYAIVLLSSAPSGCYGWYGVPTDDYPAGTAWSSGDSGVSWGPVTTVPPVADFGFKTYVVPPSTPSPPSATATGLRAAALKHCKKRAKKMEWSKKKFKKCKRQANQLPL